MNDMTYQIGASLPHRGIKVKLFTYLSVDFKSRFVFLFFFYISIIELLIMVSNKQQMKRGIHIFYRKKKRKK